MNDPNDIALIAEREIQSKEDGTDEHDSVCVTDSEQEQKSVENLSENKEYEEKPKTFEKENEQQDQDLDSDYESLRSVDSAYVGPTFYEEGRRFAVCEDLCITANTSEETLQGVFFRREKGGFVWERLQSSDNVWVLVDPETLDLVLTVLRIDPTTTFDHRFMVEFVVEE
jgi:hypothetical protein